jgi:hypothetical protein
MSNRQIHTQTKLASQQKQHETIRLSRPEPFQKSLSPMSKGSADEQINQHIREAHQASSYRQICEVANLNRPVHFLVLPSESHCTHV